ncbi:MAG: hypothetical protein Q7R92_04025 [bacterium]|nr:hypothetical protein [bacterium]
MKKIISFKKSALIIIGAFLIAAAGLLIYARECNSKIEKNFSDYKLQKKSQGKVDISTVSLNNLEQDDLWVYEKSSKRQILFYGNPIGQLQFSPSGKRFGFLEYRDIYDKKTPYDEQVMLYLGEAGKKDYKIAYRGSFKTAGWEWLNENEVVAYTGCGTECEVAFLYDTHNLKEGVELWAVGYEWSPNKQMILSYNYSIGYGVRVQNKKGDDLFLIARDHPEFYNEFTDETTAVWSPDSGKLALVIKKEKENAMELLVYNAKNNFKQILRADAIYAKDQKILWSNDSKNLVYGGLSITMN